MEVITGWGVISAIGIGAEAFTRGVREGRSAIGPLPPPPEGKPRLPAKQAAPIPDFDVVQVLGTKKGTRVLDRTAALAVAATQLAMVDSGVSSKPDYEESFGLVLGTCNGSISRTVEYTTQTLVAEKAYAVSPEGFPNTVMNFAAGQSAIWHRLKAMNTTISGGRMAFLLALRYARRMIQSGYAGGVLVGSVEELSDPLIWGAHHLASERKEEAPPLGEGGAMFALERADSAARSGRAPRVEVLACEVGFAPERRQHAEALARCIRRALERAGIGPRDLWAVSSRHTGHRELDAAEDRALQLSLEDHRPEHQLAIGRQLGECFSASGALQMAGLLALLAPAGQPRGKAALLTSLTHGGSVGCAVIRGS